MSTGGFNQPDVVTLYRETKDFGPNSEYKRDWKTDKSRSGIVQTRFVARFILLLRIDYWVTPWVLSNLAFITIPDMANLRDRNVRRLVWQTKRMMYCDLFLEMGNPPLLVWENDMLTYVSSASASVLSPPYLETKWGNNWPCPVQGRDVYPKSWFGIYITLLCGLTNWSPGTKENKNNRFSDFHDQPDSWARPKMLMPFHLKLSLDRDVHFKEESSCCTATRSCYCLISRDQG